MVQQLFDDVKLLKDEIRRLKGRTNRVISGGTIINGGGGSPPSGVLLSDATPTPVTPGAGGPGTGGTASRFDHDHPFAGGAGSQYAQFVYEVSGGDFTFIIDEVGNPVMALEDLV